MGSGEAWWGRRGMVWIGLVSSGAAGEVWKGEARWGPGRCGEAGPVWIGGERNGSVSCGMAGEASSGSESSGMGRQAR